MLTYTRTFFSIQLPRLGLLLALLLGGAQARAVTYTWNGSVSTSWNTAANWTPAAGSPPGVPLAADEAIINDCKTCPFPVLTQNQSVARLKMEYGKLDIGGFTMTASNVYFWGAKITSQSGTLQVIGVEGIRFCEYLGGKITINIGPNGSGIMHGGNTHYGPVEYRWTNTSNPNPSATSFIMGYQYPDIYKSNAVFINASIGLFNIGFNGNTFEGEVDLYNQNQGNTHICNRGTSVFHKAFRIHNSSTGWVSVAAEATGGVTFKGPVTVNNTITQFNIGHFVSFVNNGTATFEGPVTLSHSNTYAHGGVHFSQGTGGKSTFTPTASLQQASTGSFSGGKLVLKNVDFQYTQPTVISLSGAASHVELGAGTRFAGPLDVKANHVLLNGVACQKEAKIEKYGGAIYGYSPTNNLGGNIFHGTTQLINSGGQPWYFGQSVPDQFLDLLTVTHTGGNGTYLAHWAAGHVFKGNVSLNLTAGSAGTIQLGAGGGTSRLEEGRTITGNFSSGDLRLYNFTQAGVTPQNIVLTGTARLRLEKGSRFEGLLEATAGHVHLNGAMFASPVRLTKTAPGDNSSDGGNKFATRATLLNQASSGSIQMATQTPDEILQRAAMPLN